MWRVTGASLQGTSHVDRGLPCQDAHLAESVTTPDGTPVLIVAVSDGAGSASHSDRGAHLVCSTIYTSVIRALNGGLTAATATNDHVRGWIRDALDAICLQADASGLTPRDLAATCLGIVIWPDRAIGWQLGDGAIVLDDGTGGISVLTWPQRGEYANETTFLIEERDLEHLVIVPVERPVHRIAAMSDGIQMVALEYSTKTASGPFFDPLFLTVEGVPPGRHDSVDRSLAEFLNRRQFLNRTDDDRTLVVAVRPQQINAGDTAQDSKSSEGTQAISVLSATNPPSKGIGQNDQG